MKRKFFWMFFFTECLLIDGCFNCIQILCMFCTGNPTGKYLKNSWVQVDSPAKTGVKSSLRTAKHLKVLNYTFLYRQSIWRYFQKNQSMFQFLTLVEISRSMAAILEMSQYVAYQKNVLMLCLHTLLNLTLLTATAQLCHFHVFSYPTRVQEGRVSHTRMFSYRTERSMGLCMEA